MLLHRSQKSCNYVRCLQIDYAKAFDMINHPILFRKLMSLSIPPQIQRWIFQFFTGRQQAVISGARPVFKYSILHRPWFARATRSFRGPHSHGAPRNSITAHKLHKATNETALTCGASFITFCLFLFARGRHKADCTFSALQQFSLLFTRRFSS